MLELKNGESFDTEVKITLSDDEGPKYIITRTIRAKRFSDDNSEKYDTDAAGNVPKGITFSTTRNFSEKRKDGSWKSTDLDNIFTSRVEKLIPNSIAEFIIFNGELIHGAGFNFSKNTRYSLDMRFMLSKNLKNNPVPQPISRTVIFERKSQFIQKFFLKSRICFFQILGTTYSLCSSYVE